MGQSSTNGFRPSPSGLASFMRANCRRLQAKPVAYEIVEWLLRSGGCSDLSEMAIARALPRARSCEAVRQALVWLEAQGALRVVRRVKDGLRLSSVRTVVPQGAFDLFCAVLAGVSESISAVRSALYRRAYRRSLRPRPDVSHCFPNTQGASAGRGKDKDYLSVPDRFDALADLRALNVGAYARIMAAKSAEKGSGAL